MGNWSFFSPSLCLSKKKSVIKFCENYFYLNLKSFLSTVKSVTPKLTPAQPAWTASVPQGSSFCESLQDFSGPSSAQGISRRAKVCCPQLLQSHRTACRLAVLKLADHFNSSRFREVTRSLGHKGIRSPRRMPSHAWVPTSGPQREVPPRGPLLCRYKEGQRSS